MPRIETMIGVLKTFWSMSKEEWNSLDHKLLKIGMGIVFLAVSAYIWLLFRGGLF